MSSLRYFFIIYNNDESVKLPAEFDFNESSRRAISMAIEQR